MQNQQYERSLSELLSMLPPIQPIGDLLGDVSASCFVGLAGFEPRCASAAAYLRSAGWRAPCTVFVQYVEREVIAPNREFTTQLCGHLRELSPGREPITIDHDDHNLDCDFGEVLLGTLRSAGLDLENAETHLVFDISAASSRLLLEGLHALMTCNISLTLVYSEPIRYRPTFDEYLQHLDAKRIRAVDPPEFLTRGIDRVEVLRRFPGANADSRPSFLVLFPSFSFTRACAVIQEISPSRVQWIFGIPHLVENRWRLDAQQDYHRSLLELSHRKCMVSTFDYRETLEVLENIYRKRRSSYSMVIASLGSKLQKVGQVLFHLLRPEVAAVASVPITWQSDGYSTEEPTSIHSISMGNTASIRDLLQSTRRFRL